MADLHQLNFDDIVDYLERLGNRLDPARNVHLQEAFEPARITSGLADSVLRHQYESISHMLASHVIRAIAARTIGLESLEGWVEHPRGVLAGTKLQPPAVDDSCVADTGREQRQVTGE